MYRCKVCARCTEIGKPRLAHILSRTKSNGFHYDAYSDPIPKTRQEISNEVLVCSFCKRKLNDMMSIEGITPEQAYINLVRSTSTQTKPTYAPEYVLGKRKVSENKPRVNNYELASKITNGQIAIDIKDAKEVPGFLKQVSKSTRNKEKDAETIIALFKKHNATKYWQQDFMVMEPLLVAAHLKDKKGLIRLYQAILSYAMEGKEVTAKKELTPIPLKQVVVGDELEIDDCVI